MKWCQSLVLTHLMDDGYFLLFAQGFIHHIHFWRTHNCFSKWNDGLGRTDLNFSKPSERGENGIVQMMWSPQAAIVQSSTTSNKRNKLSVIYTSNVLKH